MYVKSLCTSGIIFFFILLITGFCIQATAGENTADFKWLFVQMVDNYQCVMDIENVHNSVIEKEFKLFFKPISNVYLYLLLRDPADDFVLIFPESFKVFSTKSYVETEYYIPEDGNWMKFKKQPGNHTLYFLASKKRMKELEYLINKYQGSSINEDRVEADRYKRLIIDQLQQAERNFFFTNNKEYPTSIMGSNRDDDVKKENKPGLDWLEMTDDHVNAAIKINLDDIYIDVYTLIYE